MRVVGMVSSYLEGRLVRNAIGSLLEVGLDGLYVFEGPAGEPIDDPAVPESDLHGLEELPNLTVVVHRGRWRTDGRKRNEMLQRAKADHAAIGDPIETGPLWAVVVDADEVLMNGRYLRDRLDWIGWEDGARGASVAAIKNPPMARWPLHLVEHDGSMAVITARVFRADLLREINHSSSVVTNVSGIQEGWGNFEAASKVWIEGWLAAIDQGKMICWPPLPTEPYLVHRSNLRHPGRRGLRMSAQELVEFAKAQEEELELEEPGAE